MHGTTHYLSKSYVEVILRLLKKMPDFNADNLTEWENKLSFSGNFVDDRLLEGLLDSFLHQVDQTDFFFRLGKELVIEMHGFLGYAARSCTTLREAILMDVYYLKTQLSFISFELHTQNDLGIIQFELSGIAARYQQHFMEIILASLASMLQQILKEDIQGCIHLNYPEPKNSQEYAKHLPCQIEFYSKQNTLSFPAQELERELLSKDERLKLLAEAECAKQMQHLPARDSLVAKVVNFIEGNLDNNLSQQRVASHLNMSDSTLKRKLREDNTSYRALLESTRERVAIQLMRDGRLSITEISEKLGYNELSAFIKAFKRWTGENPRDFLEQ